MLQAECVAPEQTQIRGQNALLVSTALLPGSQKSRSAFPVGLTGNPAGWNPASRSGCFQPSLLRLRGDGRKPVLAVPNMLTYFVCASLRPSWTLLRLWR